MGQPDFTDMFNTRLSPEDEAAYQAWATANHRQNDTYDYDMRGFWKSGNQFAENGHGADLYKKPNHPTFSTQSQYAGPTSGYEGGYWGQEGAKSTFYPSAHNLRVTPPQRLQQYFNEVEPGNELIMPGTTPQARGMYPRTQSPHTRGSAVTPQRMTSGQLFGMLVGLPDRGKGATPPATPGMTTPQPLRFVDDPVTPRFARPMPARPGRTLVGQE